MKTIDRKARTHVRPASCHHLQHLLFSVAPPWSGSVISHHVHLFPTWTRSTPGLPKNSILDHRAHTSHAPASYEHGDCPPVPTRRSSWTPKSNGTGNVVGWRPRPENKF